MLGSSAAQAVVVTFNDLTPGTALATVPGWTQSVDNAFPTSPYAWVANTSPTPSGAVGGLYDVPALPTFSATVATPIALLGDGIYRPTVSFDLAIVDSGDLYAGRDRFGFAINDSSGSPTISVDLRPISQTPMPSTMVGLWEVLYTVRGGVAVNTSISLSEGANYSFKVDYTATGVTLSFGSSALENVFAAIPTAYVPASQSITGVSYTWTKSTANLEYGDNYLVFDNIAVVPEPSALAVLGMAGAPLLLRRRRPAMA